MKKSILIVSDNYPSNLYPTKGLFVFQLLQEWAHYFDVKVIVPRVAFKNKFKKEVKLVEDKCEVIYPLHLSFSNYDNFILNKLNSFSKVVAINKAFKKLDFNPYFIYTHFLWNAIPAIPLANKLSCPIFVAMGESSTERYSKIIRNKDFKANVLNRINGFVVVADQLFKYVNINLEIPKEKILLAPNGVNGNRFYPKNKKKCRELLGLKEDQFIVSFTGAFIERKGFKDLLETVNKIDDAGLICIGKGEKPSLESVLFAGTVKNEEIVNYLSASDIFIFPTRAEGSSNALLEAAACGLPIVSSYIPEIINQIGLDNAILVPVGDKEKLLNAVLDIKNDENLRQTYISKSQEIAKKYSLKQRSENIINWIELNL
jgi:teichuronic acid biosynthesis glycosyltransferase TuaC